MTLHAILQQESPAKRDGLQTSKGESMDAFSVRRTKKDKNNIKEEGHAGI